MEWGINEQRAVVPYPWTIGGMIINYQYNPPTAMHNTQTTLLSRYLSPNLRAIVRVPDYEGIIWSASLYFNVTYT